MSGEPLALRDYFAEIFAMPDRDELIHIVVLTYEFDDQQVLNLVTQRRLSDLFEPRVVNLASVAKTLPVVIYDALKTREHNRLPHFMELLPVRSKAYACHHSKAYLVVTKKHIHLALGSMNLTMTGLFANREVFETFDWHETKTVNLQVLEEFVRALRNGYADLESSVLVDALATVERRIATWEQPRGSQAAALLHQGYDAGISGLKALVRDWRRHFGDIEPLRVFAVSPFFDQGQKTFLADELLLTFSGLQQLEIVTDEVNLDCLSKRHYGTILKPSVFVIAPEIGEAERRRISLANEQMDASDLTIARNLHAKILVLSNGDSTLVYMGSANFTCKAWMGDNHEMGVATLHEGSFEKLRDSIMRGLSASPFDRHAGLRPLPVESPKLDEDSYVMSGDYPDFIQSIELVEIEPNGPLTFVVRSPPDCLCRLAAYSVCWGTRELDFIGDRCGPLDSELLLSCMLGSRNLRFTFRNSAEPPFYLPFRHAPELFAQRERFVFPSSEDWMLHYSGRASSGIRDPGEYFSEDDESRFEDDPAQQLRALRSKNRVIAMQQHLMLFSKIESAFRKRAADAAAAPLVEQAQAWKSNVAGPLKTFADVLARDFRFDGTSLDAIFKLGELLLFVQSLEGEHACEELLSLANHIQRLLPVTVTDSVAHGYVQFVLSKAQP